MKKVIMIGGAPCTGKSTFAKELSKKFNCPWISTDFIWNWMEKIVSKKEYPHLFSLSQDTAEEHYKKYSINETIEIVNKLNEDVFKGIQAFISKNQDWDLFIIEGVAIQPKFISKINSNKYDIFPIFIIDNNSDRMKNIIFNRVLWDVAKNYQDWVKEIEIDFLKQTNFNYLNEAMKLKLPYFKINDDRNKTNKEIIKYLNSKLNKNI